jgi:type II secretory pathway pseudopilin PulG
MPLLDLDKGQKHPRSYLLGEGGFSILEIATVILILGIIATVATNKFGRFKAKSRQAQAKNNLSLIASLEDIYKEETGSYGDMTVHGRSEGGFVCTASPIGFKLTPCPDERIVYGYTVTGATGDVFEAQAISGIGESNRVVLGCQIADSWTIDQDHKFLHRTDAREACP